MLLNSWLFWILVSSFALSFYDLCKKASVKNNSVFPTLFISTFSGWAALSIYLAVSSGFEPMFEVSTKEVGFLLIKSVLVASSWTATYLALRTLPITFAAPIRATGPFWTLIGAILLFSEVPSFVQGIGMLFVMAGCIFFSISSKREKASGGLKAVALAFLGTVLGSCSALYDKHLMHGMHLGPLTVLWWFLGGMTLMYAVAAAISHKGFQWRFSMPFVGILLAISDACYFNAISMPDSQISVLSLVRRSSIVLTFFVGGAIFKEKGLKKKAIALAAILLGVIILCLCA